MENDWEPWETAPKDMVIMICYKFGSADWQYNVKTIDWDGNNWVDFETGAKLNKKIKPLAWQLGMLPPYKMDWELNK